MIVSYYFDCEEEVPIEGAKHGNAKNPLLPDFHPIEHSVKHTIKEAVVSNRGAAPRLVREKIVLLDDVCNTPLSETVRDNKQVSNYKQNYVSRDVNDRDELSTIILELLKGGSSEANDSDKNQAFIQEILICNGKQANIVAFTKAAINDVNRFCCGEGQYFTVLSVDTTFNVAEYHITQTVYRNLALIKRTDGCHPWFPGPVMAHRHKSKADFSFFWQASKRGNDNLKKSSCIRNG